MPKEIFLLYEKNDDIPNIPIGIVDQRGVMKFIENQKNLAKKCEKDFHYHIFKLKGGKLEIKMMTTTNDIKVVDTYILNSYILNEGI